VTALPSHEGTSYPVPTVAALCELVDAFDGAAVGQLTFTGEHPPAAGNGAVFVEGGRICWAAASGMSRRLTQLLVFSSGLDDHTMETHFRQCQERGAPLGEHLVGQGVVSAEDFRHALLVHTAESLNRLCVEEARVTWAPRQGTGYSPRFTFTSGELLTRALGMRHPMRSRELAEELEECFREGEWAVAFTRSAASAAPDPVALRGDPSGAFFEARMLAKIGKWAASALDVAGIVHGDAPLLVVGLPPSLKRSPGADSLVTFACPAGMVVGETGAHGPARILNRRAAARRRRTREGEGT
jgi:hypothetical protein